MRGRIDSAAFFIHPMNQPPDSLLMKGIWGHETHLFRTDVWRPFFPDGRNGLPRSFVHVANH